MLLHLSNAVINAVLFVMWTESTRGLDKAQATTYSGDLEYCQWETFNATCPRGSVVVVRSALYGRMQFGRCVREDHGSIGCHADVLPALGARCSGRAHCLVSLVPGAGLHRHSDCPRELIAYLAASYDCVTVQDSRPKQCRQSAVRHCSAASGHLASDTARTSTTGTRLCPWLIRLPPGQRVDFTLHTFPESPPGAPGSAGCDVRVVVREANAAQRLPVCATSEPVRHFWTSRSNEVRVHVEWEGDNRRAFLLQYKAVGCADMEPVPHAVVERVGSVTSVRCDHLKERFMLSCIDGQWHGNITNCSTGNIISNQKGATGAMTFPFGLLIVIALGAALGVALGILMLAAIFTYKRKRAEEQANRRLQTTDPLLSGGTTTPNSLDTPADRPPSLGGGGGGLHSMWIECPYTRVHTSPAPARESLYVRAVEVPSYVVTRPSPLSVRRRSDSLGMAEYDSAFSTFRPAGGSVPTAAGDCRVAGTKSSVDLLREAVSETCDYQRNTVI